jgi:hypothetical protein
MLTHPREENVMRSLTWLRGEDRSHPAERRSRLGSSRRRVAARPRLEVLEERRVLSTLTVQFTNDGTTVTPGDGTLRGEIAAAQPGDTIVFAPGLQTITLFGNQLEINKSLTIQGPGAGHLAISGGGLSRVFQVDAGANVTISGLTIEEGNSDKAGSAWRGATGFDTSDNHDGYGGGILNLGTLALSGCTVTGNTTSPQYGIGGAFGARYQGGGIYNHGALTLSGGCNLTGNHANDRSSGTVALQGAGGGVFSDTQGSLTVLSSTVTNNTASIGADICSLGTLKISKDSTVGHIAKRL